MEIHGSYFPPSPYTGTDPAGRYPQQHPNPAQQQAPPPTPPIKQAGKAESNDFENRQRRFYPLDQDLSHSARQAINSYRDSDYAAGPELMRRVDVYA